MKNFLCDNRRPPITVMVQGNTYQDCYMIIRGAMADSPDFFGIQLEYLLPEERSDENLSSLFRLMGNKPLYVTSYRDHFNEGFTEKQCSELLLRAVQFGATLCDVPADYFDPQPNQITYNEAAVAAQKELINKIHTAGAQVLMSAHTHCFLSYDEMLKAAQAFISRGADVVKLVTLSNTQEQLLENLKTTARLHETLDHPFLFLSGGAYCKIHRMIGPMLGSCMWLCAEHYDKNATVTQPLLRAVKQVVEHFDYLPEVRD